MANWNVVSHEPIPASDPWAVVSHTPLAPQAPKDYGPVPASGKAPEGFYAVTGDDGKQTLRHETSLADVMQALGNLPGVGTAERMVQGPVRLAGKAAAGLAGIFGGGPDAVEGIRGAVNEATELPPSNDPLVQGANAVSSAAHSAAAPVDRAIGNLPAGPRTVIEGTEEAIPDIAAVLGLRSLIPEAAAAPQTIARTPAEVAQAAGYTGLKTRVDLKAPGNQSITDALISKDAGIVPGQRPSVTALENARRVGPGRVYVQAETALPPRLTQDAELQTDLGNLPHQVSQLPRSPDVDALQETMLSQPEFSRDELFANIREARERAKAHWKSDDPDKGALGDAYHALAGAYEDFAGRQLEAANAPVSLADWQAARTAMAKNYQAQGALRGEHFEPSVYGRTAEKNPHLLTGNAAIVGHVHNGLPPGAASTGVGLGDITPTALGVGAGEALGHTAGIPVVGGVTGALAGPMIRAQLERLRTRGNPQAAADTAGNPALSYFFNQGRMPPGWNRAPSSPLPAPFGGYLPAPDMVNAGGGASTASALENLGLTPDVQAAGAAHPGAARLAALRAQLETPPERPAAASLDFQAPQKWGDFSIAPPAPAAAPQGGIPFENVLEQGGTQRPPVGAPAASRQAGRVARSPAQPNVRTPPGAPEMANAPPPGPSPAQLAFKNKLAADRLRKVAGDLRLEGPGGATGSPTDRLRAALERQERGYADGGSVKESEAPPPEGVLARNSQYATPPPESGYLTTLAPMDEEKFQQWVRTNKVPFDSSLTADYDMRGFWQGLQSGDPHAQTGINPNDKKLHYSDWWKTPYHKSFSAESRWANGTAPRWNDQDQLVTSDGKVVFDERAPVKAAGGLVHQRLNSLRRRASYAVDA